MTTVARTLADTLIAHDIDVAYCLPGEETIDLIAALEEAGVALVVVRHEQHGAFMAAAHGRLTGKPGLLVTTLGPGATNALTGVAQADLCRFPLVMLSGQKPVRDNEEGSFQVVDLVALATPITRFATVIDDPATAPVELEAAIAAAGGACPGPSVVVVPEDIAATPREAHRPIVAQGTRPIVPDETLQVISSQLVAARAPVVLAGAGAQHPTTAGALRRFCEAAGIGVVATQMGKGALPEDHELSLRALGQNSADTASIALLDADLVLTVGYQPAEHPPCAWHPDASVPIVHVDDCPPRPEAAYRPNVVAVGDPGRALDRLASLPAGRHRERTVRLRSVIEASLAAEDRPPSFPPSAHAVSAALREILDPDDVVALDNGVYKLWFARHYPALGPRTLLLDNALATMGAGLATAMVAARLHPDRRVVAVCGDGGFLMNCQDLIGCRDLPNLTVLVLSDDAYGFIAWHQQEQGADEVAVRLSNPDFARLADAFGLTCTTVTADGPCRVALTAGALAMMESDKMLRIILFFIVYDSA